MNKFESLQAKDHKVAIYVPSMVKDQIIDNTDMIKTVVSCMVSLFGGCTVIAGAGSWYNEDMKRLDSEPVAIVYSYTESIDDAQLDSLYMVAELVRDIMEQWSVSVEIDNKLYFI